MVPRLRKHTIRKRQPHIGRSFAKTTRRLLPLFSKIAKILRSWKREIYFPEKIRRWRKKEEKMKKLVAAVLAAMAIGSGWWGYEKYSQSRTARASAQAAQFVEYSPLGWAVGEFRCNNDVIVSGERRYAIILVLHPLFERGYGQPSGNGDLKIAIPIALPRREERRTIVIQPSHPRWEEFAELWFGDYVQFQTANPGENPWDWQNHLEVSFRSPKR